MKFGNKNHKNMNFHTVCQCSHCSIYVFCCVLFSLEVIAVFCIECSVLCYTVTVLCFFFQLNRKSKHLDILTLFSSPYHGKMRYSNDFLRINKTVKKRDQISTMLIYVFSHTKFQSYIHQTNLRQKKCQQKKFYVII